VLTAYKWSVSIPNRLRVAQYLARVFQRPAEGYVVGRTRLRNAVVDLLACSELQAEELVDTMALLGLISYRGDAGSPDPGEWVINASPGVEDVNRDGSA
jgi:hypothetical protein